MTIDMAQFHQVFFEESFEGLDIMESGLLSLNTDATDSENINNIFRAAHSIKGGSGTFGFNDMAEYTHLMETLLDEMRDGRRRITSEAVNVLLASVDVLRDMLTAAQNGNDTDADRVKQQLDELHRVLINEGGEDVAVQEKEHGEKRCAAPEMSGDSVDQHPIAWRVHFKPHSHIFCTGNDPLRILRELDDLGEVTLNCDLSALPEFYDMEPEDAYLEWDVQIGGEIDRESIIDVFDWVEDDCDYSVSSPESHGDKTLLEATDCRVKQNVDSVGAKLEVAAAPAERREAGEDRRQAVKSETLSNRSASTASSIRVDTAKIDTLINMVGELVITQSMLGAIGEDFEPEKLERLREGLGQLERHTRELQESVMQIRMLPISFTFSRFPRLVHDLGRKLGKKIDLKMRGESTEVDKTVIEKIGDPLIHLVRNSVDHGIEMPAERIAAGKPEAGTIYLSAEHRGGNIIIEIRDDGKGLAKAEILSKGVECGLVNENDSLSDSEIHDLIFQPGFSTASVVSDVSGRGVGMDVVRRNINELGGSVEIESEAGTGSAIIVRLPLTLAILDGQTVSIGDETYIVPLTSIVESIQVSDELINLVAGKGETFKLRGEYLPILRMQDVFAVDESRAKNIADGIVVVVEGGGRKCGLLVDALCSQQQVVIKSLEENYGKVDGVSGATILGNGDVALIVDIPELMELAKNPQTDLYAGLAMTG